MNKYFLLTIVFYFFGNIFVYGQVNKIYKSFQFEYYNPEWKHVVIDTTLSGTFKEIKYKTGDSIFHDGFSHFYGFDILQVDPVFYEDKVFIIEQFGSVLESQGAFIQCLNRKTSKVIWERGYDLRNIDKSEYPSYAFINEDGQLEILGYRQDVSKGPYPFGYWKYAKMTVRKYNIETGNFIEQLLINEDDSLSAELWPTSPLLSTGVKSKIYPYNKNKYQYLELGNKIYSVVLDSNSHIIDTIIKRSFLHKYDVVIQTKMYRTPKNENLVFIYDCPFESNNIADSSEMYLMKIDNNNNLITDKDIKTELKPTDNYTLTYNIFSNDDYITFVGEEHIDIGDTTVPLMFYTVFDSDANKKEEILLRDENGNPYYYGDYSARVGQVLKLKYEPGILIFASEYGSDGYHYLNIFKTDGAGNYTMVKHLKITGKNHSIGPTGSYFTPEGDVVLKAFDFNSDFANYTNSNTFATVYMLFSAEDLDIKTGVSEQADYNQMNIYPNPTNDELYIELNKEINGLIEIYDVMGKKMITKKIKNDKIIRINIKAYSNGIHFVKVIDEGKVYSIGKLVKN